VAKRERQIAPVGRSRVAEVVDSDATSTGDADTATTAAVVAEPATTGTTEMATEEQAAEEVAVAKVEATEVEASKVEAAEVATAVASTAAVDIPNNVKATVESVCAACHVSGVANAPKYGDTAAWDARMAKGLDAVTASAITGVGAMPPRGGSSLNDEEIRLAVQYMLTK